MIDQKLMHPLKDRKFRFACHRGLSCFTGCCANLNLVLTPYDVLRLKNRLKLSSDVFLDRYATSYIDEKYGVPVVKLKMNSDENRRCPFVSPEGCVVYEDRPGACRLYPIGRAASKIHEGLEAGEYYFMVKESHCLGFNERREWTVREWLADQGLDEYNAMNDLWLEILTSPKDLGPAKDVQKKMQMFSMASYNLDRFRKFIFESRFFQLFQVEEKRKEALASDDVELMKFAFDWLRYSLFGERTTEI